MKRRQIPGEFESDLFDLDEFDRNSSGSDDYDKLPEKLQNQVKHMKNRDPFFFTRGSFEVDFEIDDSLCFPSPHLINDFDLDSLHIPFKRNNFSSRLNMADLIKQQQEYDGVPTAA